MAITINPDGVSVKGCDVIYAPKAQAGEYAPLAANLYRGCGHACAYCYVPLVTKQPRQEFNDGAIVRQDIMKKLARDAAKYREAGITEQVMMSFTTDPYHPGHTWPTASAIMILQAAGLGVCTLTKGGTRALRDLHLFRPRRDAFASTLTTLDNRFSEKWEPGAALPGDRLQALRMFYESGIFTWVSLEPTLDVEASLAIVDETWEFVDLYKVGRANYLKEITRTTDWQGYTLRMLDRISERGRKFYFKKDLQPYLPEGIHNPLRVQQHH